ncbi:stalk domain-containing protein [Paenibacillus alginolyticus]|uniref:Stalk domain-containing protein n=1 Tax=Paenibacillus alginolyticus TaxID=59839 RepID=A0ABT4GIU7_9BACL|nr:stalk domain-containing protein [Paenibacillus alginolyticus]MCY9696112.1 stalk domain-containing protein [Paenibacillus alginolyticus]MEC0143026.1 stalk domain-containing protein [Paenibacillus alginolyticus]
MTVQKQVGMGALACALVWQLVAGTTVNAAGPTLTLSSQETITSGAVMKNYIWTTTRSNKDVSVNANVVEVDLTNPNVKIDAMAGTKNQFTKNQSVLGMVKDTGAVAGVNGDFFNTQAEGVPEGAQITNGQVMATPAKISGLYSFAITKSNQPIIDIFDFQGRVTAKDGTSFELGGVNKTYYWDDNDVAMIADGLFLYTNAWALTQRAVDGTHVPTEALIQNDVVKEIAVDTNIKMVAPADGYILRGSGLAREFIVNHLKVGDKITTKYDMVPHDASKTYDWKNFKMLIGGSTLLVDEAKPSYFTRNIGDFSGYSPRSRTAIGYSKDMKTAYIITSDRSAGSAGMTLPELQQFMISAGVWRGMVLDGGGSTQMVSRPLGDFDPKLVNKTENGNQRSVVNGVGVYSTAPKGDLKGLILKGQNILFMNESSTYQFKAYDDYYNPISVEGIVPQWSSSTTNGAFKDNVFTPTLPGKTQIIAKSGKGSASMDVEVVGRDQITSMKFNSGSFSLTEGGDFKLPISVTTRSGATRELPPASATWELSGIKGTLKDGILHVDSASGSQAAQVIARYDGYSTMVTLPIGQEKVWYDLDKFAVMTTGDKYPAEVVSAVNIVPISGNKSLEISYDFTKGTGTKAAYARFNGMNGAPIEGEPDFITAKVLGDGSFNWVRAEIIDADGKLNYVSFTENMSWTGWRKVTADVSDLKFPIKIKSVYVANPANGQDERALKGKINIDDISFIYKGQLAALPKNTIKLNVYKKQATLNDKSYTLEQAPTIVNDNTLVPIRFVTEALGGNVKWDDKERKVTVVRGDKLIDLWIDNADLLVNGDRVTAEVSPKIMNNVTMVPLRLISEKLGFKVGWEPKNYGITIE